MSPSNSYPCLPDLSCKGTNKLLKALKLGRKSYKPFDLHRETEAQAGKIPHSCQQRSLCGDLIHLTATLSSESNLHIFVWCANKHTHNIYVFLPSLWLYNHTIFAPWKFDCCCLLPPGNGMTTAHSSSTATHKSLWRKRIMPIRSNKQQEW